MGHQEIVRTSVLASCFLFLVILFIVKTQKRELNWALFYSVLWTTFSLTIINYYCVNTNYWSFNVPETLPLKIPLDLLFVWIIFWGIIPFFIFKGRHTLILFLGLFFLDILLMPALEKTGIITLNDSWLIGECIVLICVWLPSYLWASFYYHKKQLAIRSLFQVTIMTLFIFIVIPFTVQFHNNLNFEIPNFNPYLFQIAFIIAFPSLSAVVDLFKVGNGTPFPYDMTSKLVKNGVYAYCRNPIQWSFTLIFIPISIVYASPLIALGTIISIAYTVGVSNPQEYSDMEKRFGNEWLYYKKSVPHWRFLWRPKNHPKGQIYFRKNCTQCEQIKQWFIQKNTTNLDISFDTEFQSYTLLQVTYVDYLGNEYKSIAAIARGLEHINLIYASLGWFMRFPIIHTVLQFIIDSMNFDETQESCDINK